MLGAGYGHPHLQPPLFESCGVPSIQHPGPLLCQFPKCSAHTRKCRGCFQYEDLVLVLVALVDIPTPHPLHRCTSPDRAATQPSQWKRAIGRPGTYRPRPEAQPAM